MSKDANTGTSDTPPTGQSVPIARSNGTVLWEYENLDMENFDLIAKVIWLINEYPGWSEDGTFTFPDGETWARLEEHDDETDGS